MTTRTTTGLLTTKESNLAFRAAFRELAHARKLSAQHMALFAIVTGKPLGHAFSPVTNSRKLANGQAAWGGALTAVHCATRYPDPDALTLLAVAGLTKDDVKLAVSGPSSKLFESQYQARLAVEV